MDCRVGTWARWQWPSLLFVPKAAVAFLLIGPPVGGFAFSFLASLSQVGDGYWSVSDVLLLPIFGAIVGLPYAYILGAVPALLAGVLYGIAMLAMGQREPPTLRYRLIAGLLAGTAAMLILFLLGGSKLLGFIPSGAAAGAASAAYLRKRPS